MAPPKFVAPVRRDGGAGSTLGSMLSFSSTSSIDSVKSSTNSKAPVDLPLRADKPPSTEAVVKTDLSNVASDMGVPSVSAPSLKKTPVFQSVLAKPSGNCSDGVVPSSPAKSQLPGSSLSSQEEKPVDQKIVAPQFNKPKQLKQSENQPSGPSDSSLKSSELSIKKRKVEVSASVSSAVERKAENNSNGNDSNKNVQPKESANVKENSVSSMPKHSMKTEKRASAPSHASLKCDEPPKKVRKVKVPLSTSSAEKREADNILDGGDDKENVEPKKSKPCVSLNDEQWGKIFQAVLARNLEDEGEPSQSIGEGIKEKKCADISTDLFEFSQSDLEECEGEQSGSEQGSVAKCASGSEQTTSIKVMNVTSPQDDSDISNETIHQTVIFKPQHSTDQESKESQSQTLQNTPLTPVISPSSGHLSQCGSSNILNNSTVPEETAESTEACSQSSVGNSDTFLESRVIASSTPIKVKSCVTASSFVTPQGKIFRPLSLSQEQNVSQISKSVLTPSKPLSLSQPLQTSTSTPNKSPLNTQEFGTPVKTPNRSSVLNNTEEPRTPVNASKTRRSSVLLTPKSMGRATSPTPSTPSCSQQFSQEAQIQFTPPPEGATAKQRLVWLQKKRLAGLWVQCDEETCKKWRYLRDSHDPTTLPEKWFCRMHPDEEFNHCEAEEKRMNLLVEEDMIFNKYSPGSLVWAKLAGFPWWPAMIEDDPDLEQFFWLDAFSDIPTWYHVVFFDDEDKSSGSRAWIPVDRLKKFQGNPNDEYSQGLFGYKKRVEAASKKACDVNHLSVEERLAKHSFAVCYKGPIGGPSKRKYKGPVGYRAQVTS